MDVAFTGGTYNFLHEVTSRTVDRFEYAILYGSGVERSETALSADFPDVELRRWRHAVREISPSADARALLEAVHAIRRFRPHVIHLHSSKAGTLGRIAAALTGCLPRTVFTPHGISFRQATHSPIMLRLFKNIERTLASCSGVVVAVSDSERDALLEAGIRAILIRNGVASREISFAGPRRSRPPWRVIAVGRLTAQKDPARFDALARTFLARSDLEFRWVGDGELRSHLTSPNITVVGWRTKDEVYKEMAEADIYCSTSSFEGLSIAALEAMSFGLPLLMSNCIGNRDLVRPGNGCLFGDVAEASQRLAEMLAMRSELAKLGEQSRKLARQEFSLADMVARYSVLYSQQSTAV